MRVENTWLPKRLIKLNLRDEKIGAIKNFIPIILAVAIVFVGMYSGGFSPTEAAAGMLRSLIVGIINEIYFILKTCEGHSEKRLILRQ